MRSQILAMLVAIIVFGSCQNAGDKGKSGEGNAQMKAEEAKENRLLENRKKIESLNKDYPRIPTEGKILENGENQVYNELKQRYKTQLSSLKQQIESTGAKMIVVLLSPVPQSKASISDKISNPYLAKTATDLGLEFFDFTPVIAGQDEKVITQLPKDGHWSVKGAQLIADHLVTIVKKFPDAASKTTYKDSERPESFGDLAPNDDEVLDGGKNLPYHIKANAQGMRMDHDLTFPKKKKRILLMGDSNFFCPFLDNDFTIAYAMQKELPDYEVYAVAQVNWTTEDYISLWNDKTKYTEPDIVIIGTNSSDIEDLFFTNRNHCSRSETPFYPSETELKYYKETYK